MKKFSELNQEEKGDKILTVDVVPEMKEYRADRTINIRRTETI